MIFVRNLNKNEKQILKSHYKETKCTLIGERAHAILLSDQKRTVKDIALILMRNRDTVCSWINDFNDRGISSIFHEYENNINASKLTAEQKKEIKQILNNPPSKRKLPREFWDVPLLKEYLDGRFGVVYESDRSYHYLLFFNGFSFKLPSPFDIKRDVEQINIRLNEIHNEIKLYLKDKNWEVLVADETRMTWETEIRRAWLRRNAKTVIRVRRDNQYQNFFGALNLKSQKAHTVRLSWQNQQTIIEALKEISKKYPGKKLCIIWDNAKWHKGKEIREALRKSNSLSHIHLVNFPPYAPDVNPQEKVWNFSKDKISNDKIQETFQSTIELFESNIQAKKFNYKIPEFVLR